MKLNVYNLNISEFDWVIPGGSNQRSNISKSSSQMSLNPTLVWYYNTDAGYPKYPTTITNNIVFTSNLEGYIILSDIYTGSKIGSLSVNPKSITSAPIIKDNSIIFTTNGYKSNFIGRYNLIEGKYTWQKDIPRCETLMIVENDFLIIATVKGDILKLNLEKGNIIWNAKNLNREENFSAFFSSPALIKDAIYIGNDNGCIYKIDLNTGKVQNKLNIGASINSDVSIYDGKIFLGGNNNYFYCLDENLNISWKKNIFTKTVNSNCFAPDKVFIAGINGIIYCLNLKDGNEIWKFKTGGTITAAPLFKDDKIYIGSFDKNIYCLDSNDGSLIWKYELEGRIRGGVVICQNYLIVTSDDKNIYCFK